MPLYDQRCTVCAWQGEVLTTENMNPPCPTCGQATERAWKASPKMQDDTLPGGPRWHDNLGPKPIWIETKTQFQRELDARGLRVKESPNRRRWDQSPWASPFRLKAGIEDAYLIGLARQMAAEAHSPSPVSVSLPEPFLVGGRLDRPLAARDVQTIVTGEMALRAHGLQMVLFCPQCETPVVASNTREANDWAMACSHKRWIYHAILPVERGDG